MTWRGRASAAPTEIKVPEDLPTERFDFETNLNGIDEAYAAMDQRRAIKSLVRMA